MSFGDRLQQLRKKKNMKQSELAKAFFLAQGHISRLENNQASPTQEILKKTSDYFNVSIDYLLGKTNNPNISDSKLDDAQFLFFEKENLTAEDEDYLKLMVETMKKRNKGE